MTTLTPQGVSPEIEGKLLAIQTVVGFLVLTVKAEHEGRVNRELFEDLRSFVKQSISEGGF